MTAISRASAPASPIAMIADPRPIGQASVIGLREGLENL